jgi:prepilin signal peptidase PulO-like enzyme (type II secretory pathway)
VFIVGLLALAIYDLRWYLLPNRIIFPLIGLALLQVCLQLIVFKGGLGSLLGPIWGVLIGGGIFWLLFQVSRGKWIGGGDVKLGALLGLILGGPAMSFLMIFGASVTGTIIALPLLALKRIKRTSRVPFGPFLIVSAVFVELFGAAIIAWYRRQLGI